MNRRDVIPVLSLAPFARGGTTGASVRKKFIGVWKLMSGESKDEVTDEVGIPGERNPSAGLCMMMRGACTPN